MAGENRKKRRKIWFEDRDSYPGKVMYPDRSWKVPAQSWKPFLIETNVSKGENNTLKIRTVCGEACVEENSSINGRDNCIRLQQARVAQALNQRLQVAGIPIPPEAYQIEYQVNGQQ